MNTKRFGREERDERPIDALTGAKNAEAFRSEISAIYREWDDFMSEAVNDFTHEEPLFRFRICEMELSSPRIKERILVGGKIAEIVIDELLDDDNNVEISLCIDGAKGESAVFGYDDRNGVLDCIFALYRTIEKMDAESEPVPPKHMRVRKENA